LTQRHSRGRTVHARPNYRWFPCFFILPDRRRQPTPRACQAQLDGTLPKVKKNTCKCACALGSAIAHHSPSHQFSPSHARQRQLGPAEEVWHGDNSGGVPRPCNAQSVRWHKAFWLSGYSGEYRGPRRAPSAKTTPVYSTLSRRSSGLSPTVGSFSVCFVPQCRISVQLACADGRENPSCRRPVTRPQSGTLLNNRMWPKESRVGPLALETPVSPCLRCEKVAELWVLADPSPAITQGLHARVTPQHANPCARMYQ